MVTKLGRSGMKVRNHTMRPRPLPPKENPLGVPKVVMKALQQETLAGDQRPYSLRFAAVTNALHELNKGG
jgi:hypothetical protein